MTGKRGKRRHGRRQRQINTRPQRLRFLIVCEGKQTEPSYFRSFRVNAQVHTVIRGVGRDPGNLLRQAKKLRLNKGPFDQSWVVFDRDEVPAETFNRVIEQAEKAGFRTAWSSPCFELWYLLHFQFLDCGIHRRDLVKKLVQLLDGYEKSDPGLYDRLLPQQSQAIAHAQRLLKHHEDGLTTSPSSLEPCTQVHDLVLELNRHLL